MVLTILFILSIYLLIEYEPYFDFQLDQNQIIFWYNYNNQRVYKIINIK